MIIFRSNKMSLIDRKTFMRLPWRMHEVETNEIFKYSISKSDSEYGKIAQLYQKYESFQFVVPSNIVTHIKKKFPMNANMVAFSLFSIALGRYFETDRVMINCTEDGRSCEGSHLQGLGMLARYFPCSVDLSGNLGLLFKVDYSAVFIDKDKLKNVFDYRFIP